MVQYSRYILRSKHMLFNSLQFFCFFPIVVFFSFIIPGKYRKYWLLVVSWFFYMCWNPIYIVLLLFSTVITWGGGVLFEYADSHINDSDRLRHSKKIILSLVIILNLLVLFFFKYLGFASDLISAVCSYLHVTVNIPQFDILLPVGISFYTFQALGYTIDVYRKEIKAEKNFLNYALFVSFFPQLVAGPIERSGKLLKQLITDTPPKFDWERARDGVYLMVWGFFLKLVLADRIAIFVDRVYGDMTGLYGWYIIVATILFALQIYCDFYGYSMIAKGTAQILGITLMDNFNTPYLAESVSEFWRRWHVSLTSWFRDYLYIPLGGNRKGFFRKQLNIMIVFLLSGLWHGASLNYVVWGGLNGFYQVVGNLIQPVKNRFVKLFSLHPDSFAHRSMKKILTFLLVDFSWLFFRAENLHLAVYGIKQVFRYHNPWILFDQSLYSIPGESLERLDFDVMIIAILILIFADVCKHHNIVLRERLLRQDWWFRWIFLSLAILSVLVFGVWGAGYESNNFIYFQF